MSLPSTLYGVSALLISNTFINLPIPHPNPELSSQTFIVTGANAGLRYESCLHLSRLGVGKLIMAVRTTSKGDDARQRLLDETGRDESSIEVWQI